MTPQEALQLLDNLAAQAQVNRQTTLALIEAIKVLSALVPPEVPHE